MRDYVITATIGNTRWYWGGLNDKRASMWYSFPAGAEAKQSYQFLLAIARTRLPSDLNYVNGAVSRRIPIDLRVEEVFDNPISSDIFRFT